MAIREYEENGRSYYAVKLSLRSHINRDIRVQKIRSGILSLKEAQDIQKELTELARREIIKKENQGCKWEDLIDRWEIALRQGLGSARSLSKESQHDYIHIIRSYTSHWMKLPVEQITPADVREVLLKMEELGRSRGRQKRLKTALHAAFTFAIDNRLTRAMVHPPTIGVQVFGSREEKRPKILTLNQIKHFLAQAKALNHPWYEVWAFALFTGCRSGELYALQWDDIDEVNNRITINKSYSKKTRLIGPTKSRCWREVPICPELATLLKHLKVKSEGGKFILPRLPYWEKGEQAKVIRQFCLSIGLPEVNFHTTRACFATQLLKDGTAPAIVMKICGWKDLKTMQFYIRLAGIEIEGATDCLKFLPEREAVANVVELFRK
jgi:integrase